MTVQWGLGTGNNALANFGMGVQLGQNFADRRDQREQSNALLAFRQQQEARLQQQQDRTVAQQEQQQRRANMGDVAKLFDGVNAENYGQRVALAGQMGLDVSGVPQAYDPAWVEQQQTALRFFAERPDAASAWGQKAIDMGFDPGTPEFQAAVRRIGEADMAQTYVAGGDTHVRVPSFDGPGQNFGGSQAIPDAAASELRANPATAAQFDEIFGQGAAARILNGGPTPQASGGFPGR